MVGTIEETLAARRAADSGEPDNDGIGDTCRIEIPFREKSRMSLTAELLRGYAEQLDNFSHRTDLPARAILFFLREEARNINRALRDTKGGQS